MSRRYYVDEYSRIMTEGPQLQMGLQGPPWDIAGSAKAYAVIQKGLLSTLVEVSGKTTDTFSGMRREFYDLMNKKLSSTEEAVFLWSPGGCRLENAFLDRCRIKDGWFLRCTFVRCSFVKSIIEDSAFLECRFFECDFSKSKIHNCGFSGSSHAGCTWPRGFVPAMPGK